MNALLDINQYINSEIKTLIDLDIHEIRKAFDTLLRAIYDGKTIYCFGNGGSAATASHFQNDFNKILNNKLDKKF